MKIIEYVKELKIKKKTVDFIKFTIFAVLLAIYLGIVIDVIYTDITYCDCVTNKHKTKGEICKICEKPH